MEHRLPYHDLCYIGLKGAEPYESVLAILCKFRPKPSFRLLASFYAMERGKNHHKSSALLEAAGILIKIRKKKSKHRAGMKRNSPGAAASF